MFPFRVLVDIFANKGADRDNSNSFLVDFLQNVGYQCRSYPLPSECRRNVGVRQIKGTFFIGGYIFDIGRMFADTVFVSEGFGIMDQRMCSHGGQMKFSMDGSRMNGCIRN